MTETEKAQLRQCVRGYRDWRQGRGLPREGGPVEVKLLEVLRAEGVAVKPPASVGDAWEPPETDYKLLGAGEGTES